MPRHDQYGTHDEYRGRRARPIETEYARAPRRAPDREGGSPNYGSSEERSVRTSRDGYARFQGRDYERENYGGGYGVQHPSRDVPAAGRKGSWMRRLPAREWRGQVGASGMDGLASERAFGTDNNEQMSALDPDRAYRRWRQAELEAHDEDYRAWRRRQAQRYDEDYARWRASYRRED